MTVKNTSFSELVLSLPGGQSITLAARGSADISDAAFYSPECQRLLKARVLIELPDSGHSTMDA